MDDSVWETLNKLLQEQCTLDEQLRNHSKRQAELAKKIARLEKQLQPATPPPLPPTAARPVVRTDSASEAKPTEPIKKASALISAKAALNKPKGAPEPEIPIEQPPAGKPQQTVTKPSAFNTGEWEINFGRVWLVRIGVLLLLTGLIFLSTYAYKNWLFNAGAGVKVAFFMTISVFLTGLGMWLEKWKQQYRQYGRVVAAGGLAAGYYTVYASHFVPSLQVLTNPVSAGLLLTLWAGIMLGYAVWKRSRVVAVMAIGLAFYGTIVNPSGWISLFSALLLSSSGIWLMLRFRWLSIGLGTLAAAYLSHAFWLGLYPGEVSENVRLTYLSCYWLLFTVAMIVPQARKLPEKLQRGITALNNGAAWCLTVFSVPLLIPHQQIGWISLGIGVFWLGLALVARGGKLWHKSQAVIYGYQGLLIASLGVMIEASGYARFLVLAVEACILLLGAKQFGGLLARVASAGAFATALITALPVFNSDAPASWQAYAGLAILSAVYTGLVKRDTSGTPQVFATVIPAGVTWLVSCAGVFYQWDSHAMGLNGAWIAVIVVISVQQWVGKLRQLPGMLEIAVLAMPVAFFAGWAGIDHVKLTFWQSVVPIVGVGWVWWLCPRLSSDWQIFSEENGENQKQKPSPALEWIFGVMMMLMLASTTSRLLPDEAYWLVLGGVYAIAGHAITQWTGRISMGIATLVFHLPAVGMVIDLGNNHPVMAWVPAIALVAHMVAIDRGWQRMGNQWLMTSLSFVTVIAVGARAFQEFDRPDLALAGTGLLLAAWAFRRKDVSTLLAGCVFPLVFACGTTLIMHGKTDWLRYVPILAALALHACLWGKTQHDKTWKPARVLILFFGLLALMVAASLHVTRVFDGSGLAICWALLAACLFCLGLKIRCRPYRLIGLWWLVAAVLHVVCIDVMQLETLGRILSFITLGLVLLVLGFLYNRFQETIRKFL